ncbi:MAG: CARDB domain-containing protein [Natrialbaceae archaeon]|nr:CARDB domain-containing protein [Natrialbaceae archaeon]
MSTTRVERAGSDNITVALDPADEPYRLQYMLVGLDQRRTSDRFNITEGATAPGVTDSTYTVAWQPEVMAQRAGVDYVDGRLIVQREALSSTGIPGIVRVHTAGNPVDRARIDLATTDRTVVDIADDSALETDANGIGESDLVVTGTGQTQLVAAAGDAVDTLPVRVTQPASFSVAIENATSPVRVGEVVRITTTVTNDGASAATETIEAHVDDRPDPVDEAAVSLDPGESTTIELAWQTHPDDGGPGASPTEYTLSVSGATDSDSTTVVVRGPAWQS